MIKLLAGFESCLFPPWNNRLLFIYASNSHCLKGGWYMKGNKGWEGISILPMKTELMEAVSGAQVPALHWRLNYFLRFSWIMKFSHLEKSFRPFLYLAYRKAIFSFALPVASLGLLSDSHLVSKGLLPVNGKGFHLVTIHIQKPPSLELLCFSW